MLTLLLTLSLTGCDSETKPSPKADGADAGLKVEAPPTAMTGVRFGGAFVRCCWFATFTPEQRTSIEKLVAGASAKETVARTAVATAVLDATQAIADKKPGTDFGALATGQAKAERAWLDEQVASLDALVSSLGAEQLDAGGTSAATKALVGVMSTNPWLTENNPFDRVPPSITDEAITAQIVTGKLQVARSFLTYQTVAAGAAAKIATLDVSSPEWATAYPAARKETFDAWEAHRTATIAAYLEWAAGLPDADRQRLVLEGGVQASLNLPPTDEAMEGGGMAGGGMGMGGGAGGGMGGGAGGMGGGAGGMGGGAGGMGGGAGGMGGGMQGGGMGGGMQGGGMGGGMQGGGMQGGGMQGGMQGGGMQGGGMQGGGMQGGGMQGGGMQGGGMQGGGMQGGGMQGGGMQGGGMQGGDAPPAGSPPPAK